MSEKSELNRNHELYLLEKHYENIQCIQDIMKRPQKDPSFSHNELSKYLLSKEEIAEKKNYLILSFQKKLIISTSFKSEAELYRDIQFSMSKRIANEITKLANSVNLKDSFFNKVKLMHDKELLNCLKEVLSIPAKAILSEIILFSRDSMEFDISASNAITILNYASHLISMKDFHGIRVPEADLSHCSFINVNFENSYLKGANLSHTFFYGSNLQNCNLEGSYFEQQRPLLLKNALYKSEIIISSSGKYIAYIEHTEKWRILNIIVRSILTQEIITEINVEGSHKHILDFSIDEKYLAIGSEIYLKLIDLNNRQIAMSAIKDPEKLDFLKFSYNGNYIALATPTKKIYLWSVKTELILVNVITEASLIKKLLCPRLSNFMIVITEANIKFYDLFKGICMRIVSGNFKKITWIDLSPNEKYFILFIEKVIQIINIEDFEIKFNKKLDAPSFVSISPCGKLLSLSDCNKSKIFNLESQIFLNEFKSHEKKAKRIIFSPNGENYLMAQNDYCLKFFNYDDFESHKSYEKQIYSISFSSHQKKHYLAISRPDTCIKLDLDNDTLVSKTPDSYFSTQILFKYNEKSLILLNLTTRNITTCWYDDEINRVGISPSGKYAAIAFGRQTVEFKDLEFDKTLITWNSRFDDIRISSSTCGQYFAITVYNKNPLPTKIVIWEIQTRKKEFEVFIKDLEVGALACSSYGQYLAFGYKEKLKFWDVKGHKELFCLVGHKAKVSAAAFSFSGAYLTSGSEDRNIILWAIDENSKIIKIAQVFAHSSMVSSITFSWCNKYFISLGFYGEIIVWKIKRNLEGKEITLKWTYKNFEGTSVFSTNFSHSKLSLVNQNFIDYAIKLNSQE